MTGSCPFCGVAAETSHLRVGRYLFAVCTRCRHARRLDTPVDPTLPLVP